MHGHVWELLKNQYSALARCEADGEMEEEQDGGKKNQMKITRDCSHHLLCNVCGFGGALSG